MNTTTLTLRNYCSEKTLVMGLFAALGICFLIYGYFVNATIVNIVERQTGERIEGELTAAIGDLEARYARLRTDMTYERAQALGFSEPPNRTFVSVGGFESVSAAF